MNSSVNEFSLNANENELFMSNHLYSWLKNDIATKKLLAYLYPHSKNYHSELRPLFLFQIRDFDLLNSFSSIMAKDGLFSLLKFFNTFPAESLKTSLLIQEKLAYIVPENFKNKIKFYKNTLESQKENHIPEKIFIIATINPYHNSLDYVKSSLEKLIKRYGNDIQKASISCFLISPIQFYEIDELGNFGISGVFESDIVNVGLAENYSCYNYKFAQVIQRQFKDIDIDIDIDIEFVNWHTVQAQDLKDSMFLDLNESNFLYSDSFIIHHFLSKGSIPFNQNEFIPSENKLFSYKTSPFHSIEIHNNFPSNYEAIHNGLAEELVELKKYVLKEEFIFDPRNNNSMMNFSNSFQSFAHDVSKNISKAIKQS